MTIQFKIAALITLYHPPETLAETLAAISAQVDEVIVVDNGQNLPPAGAHFISNPANGLAKAQNLGIEKARELGCSHVLLLDDDSLPAPDMVQQLTRIATKRHKAKQEPAILGAHLIEPGRDAPPTYIQASPHWYRRVTFDESSPILENLYYVAASGCLLDMALFDSLGEMKESFFIYFLDTEFCLRARRAGFDVIAVRDAKLTHHFGKRSEHRLLGKSFSTTNHPPKARYYMFRNRRTLWLDYANDAPGYVLFDMLRAQSEVLRVLLFEKDKITKCKAMIAGLFGKEYAQTPQ